MTRRQILQLPFYFAQYLGSLRVTFAAFLRDLSICRQHMGQCVDINVPLRILKIVQVGEVRPVRLLTAKPVNGAVGEDALKQHGQLFSFLMAVVLHQLHHAVLDDIQSGFLIAYVVQAALECPFFNVFEEV